MIKNHKKTLSFIILFTLMGYISFSVIAKVPTMGINDGDSFEFKIVLYSNTFGNYFGEGLYLGYSIETNEGVGAKTGDTFTIKFPDATPRIDGDPIDRYEYYVNYEIMFGTNTLENYDDVVEDGLGNYVTGIDWVTQIAFIQEDFDTLNNKIASNDSFEGSGFEITNTDTEFQIKGSYMQTIEPYGTETFSNEVRVEKSTGVLIYKHRIESSNKTYEDGAISIGAEEYIIERIGHTSQSKTDDDATLPGFEFLTMVSTFLLIVVPIINKRKN